jgi:hypothetical protein
MAFVFELDSSKVTTELRFLAPGGACGCAKSRTAFFFASNP